MRAAIVLSVLLLPGCRATEALPRAAAAEPLAVPIVVRLPADPAGPVEVTYEALPVRSGRVRLGAARGAVGAYAPSPFADFMDGFEARAPDGRELEVRRLDPWTFEVAAPGAESVRLRYEVDAARGERELEDFLVSTHLRPGHAMLSGYATFLFVEGCEALPHQVRLLAPPGWRVAWAHPRDGQGRFVAASALELLDEPAMAGERFVSRPLPEGSDGPLGWVHVWSEVDAEPPQVRPIAEAAGHALEGIRGLELPPLGRPYHVFFELFPDGVGRELGWALEHGASMQGADLASSHLEPSPRLAYHVTHHVLHAFLPRRLFTDRLAPARQLAGETTGCLWLAEGFAQYLAFVAMGRAEAAPVDLLLAMLGRRFAAPYLEAGPRAARPMADLSRELSAGRHEDWVLGFAGGGLLALWLEERLLAEGAPDLAEVVRRLLAEARPEGIPEAELRSALESASGLALEPMFARHVEGGAPLPVEAILEAAGLVLADGQPAAVAAGDGTAEARRLAEAVLGPARLGAGDQVVYRYSGSFTTAPVLLTERVLAREGDRLEIEVTAARGEERRRWVQVVTDRLENRRGNVVDELHVVGEDGVRALLPNEGNRDLLDLYSWTLPRIDGPPTSRRHEDVVSEVAGAPRRCVRETLDLVSEGRPARMASLECPRFPWRHAEASLIDIDTGETLWRVDLAPAPAPGAPH